MTLPVILTAQVFDDFEDGNFTNNPSWQGTQSKFKVNTDRQLQLDDSMEAEAYLSTLNSLAGETEWQIWVKLGFSPSANNNARIYLVSNKGDVTDNLNGYFIQLGESGSNDAIELFRQEGQSLSSVCRGQDGLIASAFELRLKIIRSTEGLWQIYADPKGGENFQYQCEGTDAAFFETSHFGIYCNYTISNSTKIYFDDVYSGPVIVDNVPPQVSALHVESDSTLALSFTEPVDSLSAVSLSNYSVSEGISSPASANLADGNYKKVNLIFDKKFENGKMFTLSVQDVEDLSGNSLKDTLIDFSFYQPMPFDLVINEIMADPSPPVGVPNHEYIELLNLTNIPINLQEWNLTIGSSEKVFENVVVEPGGFLIVADSDAETELAGFGNFFGFSSFSLTNSGQSITLTSPDGVIISQITYSDNWYQDFEKEDGGWSLEQINPQNWCSSGDNWIASESPLGGTPGSINSVYQDVLFSPRLLRLEMVSENKLKLFFSQKMSLNKLSDPENYMVDNEVGNPAQVIPDEEDESIAELSFSTSFNSGKVYQLSVKKDIENCIGLSLKNDTSILFGIGEYPQPGDLVINEILFNPWTKGVDFVEVYNKSFKVLDLSKLLLGTGKISPPNPIDTLFYPISQDQFLMVPGSYFVFTTSAEAVKNQYFAPNPTGFIEMDKFPSYNNDEGICLLKNVLNELIDSLDYSDKMHYPLLNYHDGVSLERISPEAPTQDKSNWHSAAETVGFATPAYKNSQFVSTQNDHAEIIIEPELFSPDNDGYNDVLGIYYNFDEPGYSLTVNIYNADGRLVKHLANNQYIGSSGTVNWDGLQDDNSKAPVGIYVFFIRVFDTKGNVKQYKKTAVLASKL